MIIAGLIERLIEEATQASDCPDDPPSIDGPGDCAGRACCAGLAVRGGVGSGARARSGGTHFRRQALTAGGFSEMALYVLVEREGRWWLAAAQNTPIRQPDGAPATAGPSVDSVESGDHHQ